MEIVCAGREKNPQIENLNEDQQSIPSWNFQRF